MVMRQSLELLEVLDQYDISATVVGGGHSAQAEAMRHGIARALILADAERRPSLKRAGFLTRDSRKKGAQEVRSAGRSQSASQAAPSADPSPEPRRPSPVGGARESTNASGPPHAGRGTFVVHACAAAYRAADSDRVARGLDRARGHDPPKPRFGRPRPRRRLRQHRLLQQLWARPVRLSRDAHAPHGVGPAGRRGRARPGAPASGRGRAGASVRRGLGRVPAHRRPRQRARDDRHHHQPALGWPAHRAVPAGRSRPAAGSPGPRPGRPCQRRTRAGGAREE